MRRLPALFPLLCVLSLALADGTEAAKASGKVSVCSAYGNGCLTARARHVPLGQQVELKSGTWIDCRGDCVETLRQDVLDFWETQSKKALIIR